MAIKRIWRATSVSSITRLRGLSTRRSVTGLCGHESSNQALKRLSSVASMVAVGVGVAVGVAAKETKRALEAAERARTQARRQARQASRQGEGSAQFALLSLSFVCSVCFASALLSTHKGVAIHFPFHASLLFPPRRPRGKGHPKIRQGPKDRDRILGPRTTHTHRGHGDLSRSRQRSPKKERERDQQKKKKKAFISSSVSSTTRRNKSQHASKHKKHTRGHNPFVVVLFRFVLFCFVSLCLSHPCCTSGLSTTTSRFSVERISRSSSRSSPKNTCNAAVFMM